MRERDRINGKRQADREREFISPAAAARRVFSAAISPGTPARSRFLHQGCAGGGGWVWEERGRQLRGYTSCGKITRARAQKDKSEVGV